MQHGITKLQVKGRQRFEQARTMQRLHAVNYWDFNNDTSIITNL